MRFKKIKCDAHIINDFIEILYTKKIDNMK